MSWSDLTVAAVAAVCFNLLWWCRSLAGRLGHIERTSKTDALTGLGSGPCLDTERWPAALRSGLPLCVVYLDLDHLKARNDRHGHAVGDLYIQQAADALRQASRRGVDELFRLYTAGDEFVILFSGPLDPGRIAVTLCERLRNHGVSASIGIAYSTETGYLPARVELRQSAERLCREAKQLGGNRALVATLPAAGDADAEAGDNIPEPILGEPMAGQIAGWIPASPRSAAAPESL